MVILYLYFYMAQYKITQIINASHKYGNTQARQQIPENKPLLCYALTLALIPSRVEWGPVPQREPAALLMCPVLSPQPPHQLHY